MSYDPFRNYDQWLQSGIDVQAKTPEAADLLRQAFQEVTGVKLP